MRVGAKKCNCGNYIEDDEVWCVDCDLWDEAETQWWRDEEEWYVLKDTEVTEKYLIEGE